MFHTFLYIALGLLALSILLAMYRLLRGKSLPDRVLVLDAISYNIIAIVAVLAIILDSQTILVFILMMGILSFLGTVALSKFIERGVVFDSKRDD